VCLWLVGSSVGRRSWELRAGNFWASDQHGCPGSAELGPVPLSLLLLPGASGCLQTPLDVAGRETPERGGLGQSQKRLGSEALVAGMQGKGSRRELGGRDWVCRAVSRCLGGVCARQGLGAG
jgi:hypothetical protein